MAERRWWGDVPKSSTHDTMDGEIVESERFEYKIYPCLSIAICCWTNH